MSNYEESTLSERTRKIAIATGDHESVINKAVNSKAANKFMVSGLHQKSGWTPARPGGQTVIRPSFQVNRHLKDLIKLSKSMD